MLLKKQHTIDDMIACGQWLVENKYTSTGHLAGEGASNGGITIGGAMTQRPDLFAAALIRVGVSNPLRFEQTQNVLNVPEFGSVTTEEGFKDYDAGHGLGSTAVQRDEELADEEAFLLSQFDR
jgi:prolyl oligopeptidase